MSDNTFDISLPRPYPSRVIRLSFVMPYSTTNNEENPVMLSHIMDTKHWLASPGLCPWILKCFSLHGSNMAAVSVHTTQTAMLLKRERFTTEKLINCINDKSNRKPPLLTTVQLYVLRAQLMHIIIIGKSAPKMEAVSNYKSRRCYRKLTSTSAYNWQFHKRLKTKFYMRRHLLLHKFEKRTTTITAQWRALLKTKSERRALSI